MHKSLMMTALLFVFGIGGLHAQTIHFSDQTVLESRDIKVPTAPKTSFKMGEGIYGFAALDKPIVQTTINGANPANFVNVGYFVKVNGVPVTSDRFGRYATAVPGAMYSKFVGGDDMYSSKVIYIVILAEENHPRLTVPDVGGPGKEFLKAVAKAGKGSHKVDVELRYINQVNKDVVSNPIATGSFTFQVDKAVGTTDLDGTMPAAKMSDAALNRTMVAALKTGGWKYQVLKINIVSPTWTIHRGVLGNITHRTIDTYTAFKMDDGTCKAFNISFRQDYYSSRFNETQVNGTGDSFEISCTKLGVK